MTTGNPGDLPQRPGYGEGIYRRRITLDAEPKRVTGELEDDFHHFRATLEHDGQHVTRAVGEALRVPWTTCPAAMPVLSALEGVPLTRSLLAVARYTNPRMQCTHTFDAACLAVAHAARCEDDPAASRHRRYAADLPDRRGGRTLAVLRRDGQVVLRWQLDKTIIEGPEPFAGRPLSGGAFASYCEETLSPDDAEAAQVMRRACVISMGRVYAFEEIPRAGLFSAASGGACHSFRPEIVGDADRVPGTTRDFTDTGEAFHAAGGRMDPADGR
jgi:hypothetical protein